MHEVARDGRVTGKAGGLPATTGGQRVWQERPASGKPWDSALEQRLGTSAGGDRHRGSSGFPAALLALQRSAGNRATATLLSRYLPGSSAEDVARSQHRRPSPSMLAPSEQQAEEVASAVAPDGPSAPTHPVGGEGGRAVALAGAPSSILQRLERARLSSRPVHQDLRSTLEPRLGAGLERAKLHTGPVVDELADAFAAEAFTHRSDVFVRSSRFAPGSPAGRRLLAHELTHVAQQRSTAGIVQRFGIGDVTKSLGKFFSKLGKNGAGQSAEGEKTEGTEGATGVGERARPDEGLADSKAYESSLGRFLFSQRRSLMAAAVITDRMIKALFEDFDEQNKEHQERLAKAFGKDTVTSAGQVGTQFSAVWAALREGNLRERMTAIYNAMFGDFKAMVNEIISQSLWDKAARQGLNVEKLKRRQRQLRTTPGARDIYRKPGSPTDRKKLSSFTLTGRTRTERQGSSERTVGGLEQGPFPIGLSEREKALQFPDADPVTIGDEKLKWQEGGTYFEPVDTNKWVTKVRTELKMPVVAGPSGTALRFFQLWEWLKKPVPAVDLRDAVLGWMLTSNDHSFHEMMMVMADYGVPYKPGLLAYRHLEPISEAELREKAAIERTFPDEKAFARRVREGKTHLVQSDRHLKEAPLRAEGSPKEDEKALWAALLSYTDEEPAGYKFMNKALAGGAMTRLRFLKLVRNDPELREAYNSGKFSLSELVAEAQEASRHASSALERLNSFQGIVYRGFRTWSTRWMKPGKVFTSKKFFSASQNRVSAEPFADVPPSLEKKAVRVAKPVGLAELVARKAALITIKSKTGVKLGETSMVVSEQEVLFRPGTRFRVSKAPVRVGNFVECEWEDVSEGSSEHAGGGPEGGEPKLQVLPPPKVEDPAALFGGLASSTSDTHSGSGTNQQAEQDESQASAAATSIAVLKLYLGPEEPTVVSIVPVGTKASEIYEGGGSENGWEEVVFEGFFGWLKTEEWKQAFPSSPSPGKTYQPATDVLSQSGSDHQTGHEEHEEVSGSAPAVSVAALKLFSDPDDPTDFVVVPIGTAASEIHQGLSSSNGWEEVHYQGSFGWVAIEDWKNAFPSSASPGGTYQPGANDVPVVSGSTV